MNQQRNNTRENQEPIFSILFRVKAKRGKRQKLVEFLKWDCQVCMEEHGTLRFDVWADSADEDAFYVYEAYQDRAAFDKHKENKPYQQWSSEVEPEWISEKWTLFMGEPICLLNRRENSSE